MSLVIATENTLASLDFRTENVIKSYKQCENIVNGLIVHNESTILSVQKDKPLIHVYSCRKEAVVKRIVVASKLSALAMSPNNQWLAAGSKEGTLYVWNIQSGALRALHSAAHFQPVTALSWSADGSVLVSGGADARVLVWRTMELIASSHTTTAPKHVFTNHTLAITAIHIGAGSFREARLYTTSLDATCSVFDIYSGTLLYTLVADSKINSLVVDPAERAVYLGCEDGVHIVPLYYEPQNYSKLVTAGSAEGEVVSTNSIERVCRLVNDDNNVTAVTLSLDGSFILSGMSDGSVVSWEVGSGQMGKKYRHSKGKVTQIVFIASNLSKDSAVNDIPPLQRNLEGDALTDFIPRGVITAPGNNDEDIESELESISAARPVNVTVEDQAEIVDEVGAPSGGSELEELKQRHAKLQKMYDALWAKHTAK